MEHFCFHFRIDLFSKRVKRAGMQTGSVKIVSLVKMSEYFQMHPVPFKKILSCLSTMIFHFFSQNSLS